ncbi:MAG: hypothetical protein HFH15_13550 [Ruminococcus sp.]|nr:hypothetical protein [Ruminococcus sp.]
MREILSLNEGWRFVKDSSLKNLAPDCGEPVTLPHTWSTNDDAQRGYDGRGVFKRGEADPA